MFIYVIRHTATGREYIGKSCERMGYRFKQHQRSARAGVPGPLYDALRVDGVGAFKWEVLAFADSHEELCDLERQYVHDHKTLVPHGFNRVRGGLGTVGYVMSAETKQKIAAKAMGRVAWNKGVPMSAEQRALLSRVRKGKPKTPAQLATVQSPRARAQSAANGRRNRGQVRDSAKWSETQRRVQAEMSPEAKAIRNQKVSDTKRAMWTLRHSATVN